MAKITTTRFDFAAVTPTGYPPSGSYIIGLDIADDKLKKMDSNGVLTIIGDGSGPDIFVSDTFANINTLVSGDSLEPGAWYEITDPAGFPLGLLISPGSLYYHTATLIIRATSVNTFDPIGILKANYVNQSLIEGDMVIYDYNGSNLFTNIKRRIDKRGNDVQGNINLFQWGNDNVISNQVDSTSSLHIVDTSSFSENSGQVKWNILKTNSTLTAFTATASSIIIGNSLEVAEMDASLNQSTIEYNNFLNGSSVNISSNDGGFSFNDFGPGSVGNLSSSSSPIVGNKFGNSASITATGNAGNFSYNIFGDNYTLNASGQMGNITINNFGSGGQSNFDGFTGNFVSSSVFGAGLLDMSAYTETVTECKITVNEFVYFANMINDNGDQLIFQKVELTLHTYGYVERGALQFTTNDNSTQDLRALYFIDGQVAHLRWDAIATKGSGTSPLSFAQSTYDAHYSKMDDIMSGDIQLNIGNTNTQQTNFDLMEVFINNGNYSLIFRIAGDISIPSSGIMNYTFTTTKFLSNA